jgi:hypothetical protein
MSTNEAKTFQAIILLNEILNNNRKFKTIMNEDDHILEQLFIDLLSKGYVKITGDQYTITELGKKVFDTFMVRYQEYLKIYDIFSFVDLEKGEFAFAKYFDFNTDAEFDTYKVDERFDDVRIAVSRFKKMNSFEIVFMSFINENRFDTTKTGWQIDLLSDDIWMEIDDIVKTAISIEQLGGEDVIKDIVEQGSKLMIELIKQEAELRKQDLINNDNPVEETETIEVIEEEVVYYESYYDPYYVSAVWYAPLFIW